MRRIVRKPTTLAVRYLSPLVLAVLAAGVLSLGVTAVQAGPTPEQKCAAGKNKAAGKYAACRQNAEANLATTGDTLKYNGMLTKCGTKFASAWQKTIDKATAAGATCLDAPLTAGDFQTSLDESSDNIADALVGLGLTDCSADLATCAGDLGTCTGDLGMCTTDLTQATGDLASCNGTVTTLSGDLSTCNGSLTTCNGNLGTCTTDLATCQAAPRGQRLKTGQTNCYDTIGTVIACAGTGQDGELQKGLARVYTDNGDGTITDAGTGLMWEKLSDDGSIHDWDNRYEWANAFAVKVAGLNGGGGFAGHTDWRVPNVNELQSLLSYGAVTPSISPAFNTACAGGCTVTTCSCTQSDFYLSATTYQYNPSFVSVVDFSANGAFFAFKGYGNYVRGVRGGS